MTIQLAPHQFHDLITDDWSGNGPISLNPSLPAESYASSSLFTNARILLKHLIERGPSKATASGNLSRKLVAELTDKMVIDEDYLRTVNAVSKVINEEDIDPLHCVRVILDIAKVIRKYKGSWRVTKKHENLVEDDQAGELFKILFYTHFKRLNLDYLDRMSIETDFQAYIAYPLYVLSKMDRVWRPLPELLPDLLLMEIVMQIPDNEYYDPAEHLIDCQLIRPLESLGMLETRAVKDVNPAGELKYVAVRKTELFDEFFRVEFKEHDFQ